MQIVIIFLLLLPLLAPIQAHTTGSPRLRIRPRVIDHAKVARRLVHQANWSPFGTISSDEKILGYPMVNTIAVDDSDADGASTGKIRFLLTDKDYTGVDWQKFNKVTLLFSDEQTLNCQKHNIDPMEPICARTIISGQVVKMDPTKSEYGDYIAIFEKRHPAAKIWLKVHSFYLCELNIENIFVLDMYGGPHTVTPENYYNAQLA